MNQTSDYYLRILDAIPHPVWRSGADSKWDFFNQAWLDFTGRPFEKEIGQGWIDHIHPGDLHGFVQLYLDAFDSGEPFSSEYRMRHRDGSFRWIHVAAQPTFGINGVFEGYLGFCNDVTETRHYQQAIRESEQRLRTIEKISPMGVFRFDAEGSCQYVNERWREITGLKTEDAIGAGWLQAIHPDDRESARHQFDESSQEMKSLEMECRFAKENGEVSWILVQLRPEFDEDHLILGFVGTITNLGGTHRHCEEQLKVTRFESLGILAGGIAHDFNNLLTPILLNLAVAKSELAESPGHRELVQRLDEAERASHRARSLSQQLLTFTKGGDPVLQPVLLPELLRESVRFALHGSRLNPEMTIPGDLWPVKVDVGQFNQVIQNIVINAAQAMDQNGALRVGAANLETADSRGKANPGGKQVRIWIEDNGCGIAEENLQRIFEPYFSTKMNGNGLGLTTALSIVRKHGGQLAVESEAGSGTTVSMILPATALLAQRAPERSATTFPANARVLIMDDEELILNSMRAVLSAVGFAVETATDGTQALRIFREAKRRGQPIDLTLMDLTVQGGMGGKEAIAQLKAIDPEAKAVVCSGYSNDPIMANYEEYGFNGAIQKPFKPEELRVLLNNIFRESV